MNSKDKFPKLIFAKDGGLLAASEIDRLIERVGALHPSLREWLAIHNGGLLGRQNYFVPMQSVYGLPCGVAVEYLHSVSDIHYALDKFEDAFPEDFTPFAEDGDGNYLLINNEDGEVYFWDWMGRIDADLPHSIDVYTIKIANSLSQLFQDLGDGPIHP